METLLEKLKTQGILLYIDDVLISSATFEQHLEKFETVFSIFRDNSLKIKPNKYFLKESNIFRTFGYTRWNSSIST